MTFPLAVVLGIFSTFFVVGVAAAILGSNGGGRGKFPAAARREGMSGGVPESAFSERLVYEEGKGGEQTIERLVGEFNVEYRRGSKL